MGKLSNLKWKFPHTFLVPSITSTKNWSVSQIGYGCPLRWKKRTVNTIVPPTTCGSVQSHVTLQLAGSRYFPVTYCSSECLASGANDGWVIAANVTSPATDTETTSIPPHVHASWCWLDLTTVDHRSAFRDSSSDFDVGSFCRASDQTVESFPRIWRARLSSNQYTSSNEDTSIETSLKDSMLVQYFVQ